MRSSNFEELSSRPLGRGVVKQNIRQRSRRTAAADSSKTSTSNISSCRTGRHARPQAHRRTQTHTLTQAHKTILNGTRTRIYTRRRPATVLFFHVTVTAKRRHAHSKTQLKNCFSVRRSSCEPCPLWQCSSPAARRSSLTSFWVPTARWAIWRTQQVVNLQSPLPGCVLLSPSGDCMAHSLTASATSLADGDVVTVLVMDLPRGLREPMWLGLRCSEAGRLRRHVERCRSGRQLKKR